MTPGPKKRGRQYKTEDKQESRINEVKGKLPKSNETVSSETNVAPSVVVETEDTRYQKGVITSNWQRYDEPEIDAHADVSRGRNFDVLLSYSSGAGSQLQLQDEKTWEDDKIDGGGFVLDLNRLASAYKCIPLHKQLHLSEDLFDYNQIIRLQKCADNNLGAFEATSKSALSVEDTMNVNKKSVVEEQSNFLHIVDSWDVNNADAETNGKQLLAEETGNLIQSLTSCLSLKDSGEPANETKPVADIPDPTTKDNLDFLLALSSTREIPVTTDDKKINVDEWLDSILDN